MSGFDFISAWLAWGDPLPAPSMLRKWAGIAALSAILSRRVWLQANSRLTPLYPNLFIILAAPPRVGKDIAINGAAAICRDANARAIKKFGSRIVRIGGESISPKGLVDELNDGDSKQTIRLANKETMDIHSLSYFIGEGTTAMPEYNTQLIGFMNDLWNCKPSFRDRVRGTEFTIKNPHLMLCIGNQPDTLYRIFPEAVFKMGFTARVFFIYAPSRVKKKVWLEEHEEENLDDSIYDKLVDHLVRISQWSGRLKTTAGFREAVNNFEFTDPCPVPGSRFEHWNGGRCINTQKLAMILAASEGSKTLTVAHWERAVGLLFEAEKLMPQIFANVTSDRGFAEDLENIPKLCNGQPIISQYKLLNHLSKTRPPHEAKIIIEQAVQAGMLNPVYDEAGAPVKPIRYKVKYIAEDYGE